MAEDARRSNRRSLFVLHPVFALTGVLHAIGGTLLPSLASAFRLTDSQSGLLFLLYFAGSSLGALFCRRSYARIMTLGFAAIALSAIAVAVTGWPWLLGVFLCLGISVGIPMSAVSLFTGCAFADRCAPVLAFLNFSWSAGALLAPIFAGWVLLGHTYRFAYLELAGAASLAAVFCALALRDPAPTVPVQGSGRDSGDLIVLLCFAAAAFLQVGVENTAAAWLSTFSLRANGGGVSLAAMITGLYWAGFLVSRGVVSLVLLRAAPMRVLRAATAVALAASVLLWAADSAVLRGLAMFLLGIALAPVYPLVVAGSLMRVRRTADSRWVLASAGFGGSVLPWVAGWISAHTGSLRTGMLALPGALLLMLFLLPSLGRSEAPVAHNAGAG